MKKTVRHFTLVEMLTVVAIIGILAGIIIPTVIIAQNRGRETQAKTDIASIMTALKQVKIDYGTIVSSSRYVHKRVDDPGQIIAAHPADTPEYLCKFDDNSYDSLIAELSVPRNEGIDKTVITKRINKRRKVYLDPKNSFNPNEKYYSDDNEEKLWRDPWGQQYVIYINRTGAQELEIPKTDNPHGSGLVTLATDIAVYSCGPNGTDDSGCNAALDNCIKSGDSENHKNHDDIASWNL